VVKGPPPLEREAAVSVGFVAPPHRCADGGPGTFPAVRALRHGAVVKGPPPPSGEKAEVSFITGDCLRRRGRLG
jgi:hypothetical protein